MKFCREVLKGGLFYFTIAVLLEILVDLYFKSVVDITIGYLIESFIVGILLSVFTSILSSKWKKYYLNK